MTTSKPSLMDAAKNARGAFLLGCGGGGDIIQTIPVMNYLRRLGVEKFVLGEYCIKWHDKPGFVPFGCEAMRIEKLKPAEKISENVVRVTGETRYHRDEKLEVAENIPLHEAMVAKEFDVPVVSIGVANGPQGVLAGIKDLMKKFDLDLFACADMGTHCFYTGEEMSVQSPMIGATTLYVLGQLDGYYGMAGWGCDAEMPTGHIDRNFARVMQAGGFLGGHGLTPKDVADLTRVLDHFPDEEVEQWPRDAARGKLGTQYSKTLWYMYVTPLAAVTLFLDPKKILEINPLPAAIGDCRSLVEAEERILEKFNVVPETRMPMQIKVPTDPQIPK